MSQCQRKFCLRLIALLDKSQEGYIRLASTRFAALASRTAKPRIGESNNARCTYQDLEGVTQSQPGMDAPFDVAILGGGASGVLVAIHLLQAASGPLRIVIIEPRANLGQGVAYSTHCPEHLLNVIASRMSAFVDDPSHFVRFLSAAQDATGVAADAIDLARCFARRMDFGRYLLSTLQTAPRVDDVQWIQDEAINLVRGNPYSIELKSGGMLSARNVVLASGNDARPIPLPAGAIRGEPRTISAWDYAAVRGIERDADVCIIGSGLSMVDAVISMAEGGHRGRITVLSRHGLMPLSHARPGEQQGHVDELLALGMRARLRLLRQRALEGERNGAPWQWTMDAMRHHGQALWQHSDAVERGRFLRHAGRFWDIHRHRIAPAVAARLEQLRSSGQLVVHAGHLRAIDSDTTASRVRYRPRGAGHEEEIMAACVVNATGIETAIAKTTRPLINNLNARGVLRSGPQGLGIAADRLGAVMDQYGNPDPGLLAIGALRIGELWESIAIPELRVQAAEIAAHIVAQLHLAPAPHPIEGST